MRRGMRVAFGLVLLLCILIGGGYAFMSLSENGIVFAISRFFC